MPDWIGADGSDTAARYRRAADFEMRGVSPSYAALCAAVADDRDVLARLDLLPADKRQPNLLLGAVRFLGGPVDSPRAFRAFAVDRWDDLATTMRARRTQTNEAGRCATLLPALAALPQPLALLEVGASAGLCLLPDRYAYRYSAGPRRPRRYVPTPLAACGSGPVELRCLVTGPAPLPESLPQVSWRAGLDLHPLDVADDEDVRWLESLIWPEHVDRFARLRAAVALAREDPPRVVTGDLTRDLPALAAQAPAGATLVVFHSAVLAYVEDAGRAAFADAVQSLGAQRPTVWLSNEAPGVVPGTDHDVGGVPLFVLAQDNRPIALTGPHGHTLDWLG